MKKSFAAAGEDGVVAVVEGQLDLDRAVVRQLGGAVAGDRVAFVEAAPAEENDGLRVLQCAAGGDAAEGKLGPPVAADLEVGRLDPIEVIAVPQIGRDDAPAADQFAVLPGRSYAGASSLGGRTKLSAAAAKVKAQATLGRPLSFVWRSSATVLIQPNASSIRLRMRWLRA